MPRSTIIDRRAYHVDGEVLLHPTGTETATHQGAGVAYKASKEIVFKLAVAHSALTGTVDGANNWGFQLELATAAAGPWTPVGGPILTTQSAGGTLEQVYGGPEIEQALASATYARINTTLTGIPGDISYTGFLSPC